MKQLTDERYAVIMRSHDLLMALLECGVEEWEGYKEALELSGVELLEDDE